MKAARSIALVILLLAANFLFSSPIAHSQSTYTIRGQVVDDSGGWVPGASVRLYSVQGVLDLRADGDGKFEFRNVAKGTYELEGSSAGFITGTVDFEIAEKAPDLFSIRLHVGTGGHCIGPSEILFPRVEAWGRVGVSYKKRSGKVDVVGVERDQFGSPLAAVMVKLVKEGTSQETVSNEKGEFTFNGLQLGKYTLYSYHAGYLDHPAMVWITRENFVRAVVTLVGFSGSGFCV
jgi:hypothetical protein